MAGLDPFGQGGGRTQQPSLPQAQPLPQAAPLGTNSLPQAQPLHQVPSGRPQGQPGSAGSKAVTGRLLVVEQRSDQDEDADEKLASKMLDRAPPWLTSAAIHMLLLIILGLLLVPMLPDRQIRLKIETVYAEQLGDQLEFDSPLGMDDLEQTEEPILSLSELPEVDDPFASPADLPLQPDGFTAVSDIRAPQIGLALRGREEGSKRALLGRYGGNAITEAAVLAGLHWLAKNQRKDGSWSLSGGYADGVPKDLDNPVAATAMALLAFQGHGDTHKQGKFKRNVSRGWKWMLKEQDGDGNFYHEGPFNHRFYTQGQCTIAVCELYGMTQDPDFKEPAERAVDYCLKSQSSTGGWRYSPNSDSDVSVTGWIVMALQSAKMAGLKVPEDNFRRIERFLDKVAQHGGSRYPYRRGEQIKLSMTAEALLCRQYLGWARDDPRLVEGVQWITEPKNLIDYHHGRDVYYWYYATQVAHHMEGEHWKKWNAVMRQVVPEQQVDGGGEKGSWDPDRPTLDQWGPHGGRLYVTCLSIYMLEVYYRHLPIYTKVYTDLLKSGRTGVR